MILPPGHNVETVLRPQRLGLRERRLIAGVFVVAVLLVIGVVISVATPGPASGNGCIDYAFPYSVGGQEIYRCGTAARTTCSGLSGSGYGPGTVAAVRAACRKAGLAVG